MDFYGCPQPNRETVSYSKHQVNENVKGRVILVKENISLQSILITTKYFLISLFKIFGLDRMIII